MHFSKPITVGVMTLTLSRVSFFAYGKPIDRQAGAAAAGLRAADALNYTSAELYPGGRDIKKRTFRPGRLGDNADDLPGGGSSGGPATVGGNRGGLGGGNTAETGGTAQIGGSGGHAGGNVGEVGESSLAGGTLRSPYDDPLPGDPRLADKVPGENVLPREIPDFPGLEVGTRERTAYQRFINYDMVAARNPPPDSHYLLFMGDDAGKARSEFKERFNQGNDFRQGLPDSDQGKIVDISDVYPQGMERRLFGDDVDAASVGWFVDGLASYGVAKRAAQQGGILRVIGPSAAMNKKELDLEALKNDRSFFYTYELWAVTNGDGKSKLREIKVYNANNLDDEPMTLWKQGNPPMGEGPNFATGPTKIGTEERLIDLGF